MAVLGLRFCARAFSSCGKWGASLHRGARASHCRGLSCCGAQAPDAQAQQLWLTGLVAPRHVGSSQTRARTLVPCIGRQILNHCATREAPRASGFDAGKWVDFLKEYHITFFQVWDPILSILSLPRKPVICFGFLFVRLVLATTCSLQDLSSSTRDQTWGPAVKGPSPHHCPTREFPHLFI